LSQWNPKQDLMDNLNNNYKTQNNSKNIIYIFKKANVLMNKLYTLIGPF